MERARTPTKSLAAIGAFAVLIAASLGALVWGLGLLPAQGPADLTLDILFPSASGLMPGAPLTLLGVAVGEVQSIAIDEPPGQGALAVCVSVRVRERYAHLMREGLRVRQIPRGLLGERILEAQFPGQAGKPLASGARITGEVPVDVPELLAEISAAVSDLRSAAQEMKALVADSQVKELVKGLGALASAVTWAIDRLEALIKAIKDAMSSATPGGKGLWPFK